MGCTLRGDICFWRQCLRLFDPAWSQPHSQEDGSCLFRAASDFSLLFQVKFPPFFCLLPSPGRQEWCWTTRLCNAGLHQRENSWQDEHIEALLPASRKLSSCSRAVLYKLRRVLCHHGAINPHLDAPIIPPGARLTSESHQTTSLHSTRDRVIKHSLVTLIRLII